MYNNVDKDKKYCEFMCLLFAVLAVITLCTGCSKPGETQPVRERGAAYNWKEEGFLTGEEVSVEETLFLSQFRQWNHDPQSRMGESFSCIDSGVCGEVFWYLGICVEDGKLMTGDKGLYVLETHAAGYESDTCRYFTPGEIGAEGELGFLTEMDMTEDGGFLFRWVEYSLKDGQYKPCGDKLIFTDLEGNNSFIDVRDTFLTDELEEYPGSELFSWPYESCQLCTGNNIWVLGSGLVGKQKLCIYSPQGERILKKEAEKGQVFLTPFLNEDMELFLPISDPLSESVDIFWVNMNTGNLQKVGTIENHNGTVGSFYGMAGNFIYYQNYNRDPSATSQTGIVRWDIANGERKQFLNLDLVNASSYTIRWSFSKEGIGEGYFTLGRRGGTKDWIVALSSEKKEDDSVIRVADLSGRGGADVLRKCALDSSLENPGKIYQYEDATDEDYKDKVMVELSQKEGPEFMLVSMEDFYLLSEKGLLLDLEPLLSENSKKELLPGALEIGRDKEELLGIPIGVHVETMVLGRGVSDVTDWGLDTVIELMEQGKLNHGLWSPYVMNSYLEPGLVVSLLLEYSLSNSFLIDWEEKKCHFDDRRFVSLLEMTREDRSKTLRAQEEDRDLTWVYIKGYLDLVELMADISREGTIVGYPEQENGRGYLIPDQGILVVNRNVKDTESVRLFMEKLVSKEVQQQRSEPMLGICRFDPNDFLSTDENGDQYYFGRYRVDKLNQMEEGANPFLSAVAFLEECRPAPRKYQVIQSIIREEIQALYAGDKDAEAVAKIINNRVQLYLDEER